MNKNIKKTVYRILEEDTKELTESCRKVIKSGRCLGCTALEDEKFVGNKDCKYSKTQTAEDSIKQIKQNLGIQEKLKL